MPPVAAFAVTLIATSAPAPGRITIDGGPDGMPAGPVRVAAAPELGDQAVVALTPDGGGPAILGQHEDTRSGSFLWLIAPTLGADEKLTFSIGDAPADGPYPPQRGVHVAQVPGGAEVLVDDALLTRYVVAGTPKPFFYPVVGPTGVGVTRGWPMVTDINGESNDHPHHQSLWFGFGDVNGHDFWATASDRCKQVHRGFAELTSGPVFGVVAARNDWVTPDGVTVCAEERRIRVFASPGARVIDFEVTIRATEGPVTFGDTKEGMMSLRLCPELTVDNGSATIVNSEGDMNGDAWGKRARWCDDYGTLQGQTVGVAMLDSPTNFRHPTYWHVRTYGLFGANPFGLRDFTRDPEADGSLTIPAGAEQVFKYRIIIHEGTPEEAGIERLWRAYARNMTE